MIMTFSRFNIYFELNNEITIYNTISESIISLDKESFENLRNNTNLFLSNLESENKEILLSSKIIANDEVEVENIVNKRFEESVSNKMYIVIYPTLNCNLKCKYCFQSNYEEESMSKSTIDSLIRFIEEQIKVNKPDYLFITWMGGEPLLSLGTIEYISNYIKDNFRVNYISKIITNGYLLDKSSVQILVNCNIHSIQVTIDGLSIIHDNRRLTKEGKGTFDAIMKNIDMVINSYENIHVSIRVNLDLENKDSFPEVYNFFKSRYKDGNFSINPCFVDNFSISCKSGGDLSNTLSRKSRSRFFLDLANKHKINVIEYLPKSNTTSCLANHKYSFAVGPDGSIYKCTTVVGDKNYAIGKIDDSKTNLNANTYNFNIQYNNKCFKCQLFPICNGGCPLLRIKNNNSSQCCHISKNFEKEYIITYLNNLR